MKRHENKFKSISIGFDCEINEMLTDFSKQTINSFMSFKQPTLLKTNAVFCNGRKKKRKK